MFGLVMLNPSTADAESDDATIIRVEDFGERWEYGGFEAANLYGLRSTDPRAIRTHPDPVGPDNDAHLTSLSHTYDLIILAWGANAEPVRAAHVTRLLAQGCATAGGSLAVLQWTKSGQPHHPLRLPKTTVPQCLTPASCALSPDGTTDERWAQLMNAA
ncbi:hypothetical protein B5P44_00180 [Mycobacterium sp. CBMA 213]|nr:hypothetical protein [Mycolicibacterium sp. CBMA 213]